MYQAKIKVTLKKGVLDPQGSAVQRSLRALDYGEVTSVRIGKYMEVNLEASNKETAEEQVKEMCQRLLANPVIEDYTYNLVEVKS